MEPITISIKNNVATISNNDAPYHRMTLEYMDALESALPGLGADNNVRALVFTASSDENFSVGMNLKQLGEGVEKKGSFDAVLDQRLRVLDMIENQRNSYSFRSSCTTIHMNWDEFNEAHGNQ